MALELEKIVNKHESVLKKYRGLYVFADLLATVITSYSIHYTKLYEIQILIKNSGYKGIRLKMLNVTYKTRLKNAENWSERGEPYESC